MAECLLLSYPFFLSSDIAFSPRGVAALPSPSKFAAVFRDISSRVLEPFSPLKSNESGLDKTLDILFVMPHFSAMRIIPPHNAILPASVIQSCTALLQPVSAACDICTVLSVKKEIIIAEIVITTNKISSIVDLPRVFLIKYVTIKDKYEIFRETVDK